MGETTDQIRREIESTRERLVHDINDLEDHIRHEADWRVQFHRHPWAFAGAGFGLALLAGLVLVRRVRARR